MELIPIIEKSLLIFAGALVLVLTVSFAIFKMGKRGETEVRMNYSGFDNLGLQPVIIAQNEMVYQNEMIYQEENAGGYYRQPHYTIERTLSQPVYNEEQKPAMPAKSSSGTRRFTVINDIPEEKHSYYPNRDYSFSRRFASTKSSDAYAMFR